MVKHQISQGFEVLLSIKLLHTLFSFSDNNVSANLQYFSASELKHNGEELQWKIPRVVLSTNNYGVCGTSSDPTYLSDIELYGPAFKGNDSSPFFWVAYVTVNGKMTITAKYSSAGASKADVNLLMKNLKLLLCSL